MKNGYYLRNEQLVQSTEHCFGPYNRSYLYGDGLFESMHIYGGEIPLIHKHINRLVESMMLLEMEVPTFYSGQYFSALAKRIFNKNNITGSARIRLHVFRKQGGLYTPSTNNTEFSMIIDPLPYQKFNAPDQALFIDTFPEIRKHKTLISGIKSSNALMYVLAGNYKMKNKLDDCIILNEKDELVEAISSNLFLLIENKLYTPDLSSGCVAGIMRQKIISIAENLGIKTLTNTLTTEHLFEAKELFLSNGISGIQSVKAFRKKRYFREIAIDIQEHLNRTCFS